LHVGRVSRAAAFAGGLLGGCYTDHPQPQAPPPPHVEEHHESFAKPPVATAGGTIEGVITDTGGAPVRGQRITLQTYREGAESMQLAETDASGHYAFTGLPAGHYIVSWAPGDPRRKAAYDVTLGEHDTKRFDGVITRYTPTHQAMPYGSPPARRRVV
jgi:hypothetical protein